MLFRRIVYSNNTENNLNQLARLCILNPLMHVQTVRSKKKTVLCGTCGNFEKLLFSSFEIRIKFYVQRAFRKIYIVLYKLLTEQGDNWFESGMISNLYCDDFDLFLQVENEHLTAFYQSKHTLVSVCGRIAMIKYVFERFLL